MKKIIGSIIALLMVGFYAYDDARDERKRENAPPIAVEQPAPEAPERAFFYGRWIYVDDQITGLERGFSGDPNGVIDMVYTIALGLHYNNLPMAIGVTATDGGLDDHVTEQLVALTGTKIPIKYGYRVKHMGQSQLSDYIVSESKKGHLTIVLGGPVSDVAQAIKQGANKKNITVIGTLYGTSNERGDQAAADYIKGKVKFINIGSPEYQTLIRQFPVNPKYANGAFIDQWRTVPAWDLVASDAVLARTLELNKFQFQNQFKIRVSDSMNADRYLSGKPESFTQYRNLPSIMSRVIHGLQIMQTLTPDDMPEKPQTVAQAVNCGAFNQSTVKVHGGTQNPFKFAKTANITHGYIDSHSYQIKHTKDGKWKGKQYQPGRLIDGTDGVVFCNTDDRKWYVYMFEYSVLGEVNRPKGWAHVKWVQKGHKIGLISSTNTRNGNWSVAGQAKERSNVHWTTAK